MGPLAACATRRYHGFLTIAQRPPLGRFQRSIVWKNRFSAPGPGYPFLASLSPEPAQRPGPLLWTLFASTPSHLDVCLGRFPDSKKPISFAMGRHGRFVVTYRLLSGDPVEWAVRPLLSFRDHHALGRRDDRFDGAEKFFNDRTAGVDLPEGGRLNLWVHRRDMERGPAVVPHPTLCEEDRRGMESVEDVSGPGFFQFPLGGRKTGFAHFFSRPSGAGPRGKMDRGRREQRQKSWEISRPRVLGGCAGFGGGSIYRLPRGRNKRVGGIPVVGGLVAEALLSFPGLFLATGRWSKAPRLS